MAMAMHLNVYAGYLKDEALIPTAIDYIYIMISLIEYVWDQTFLFCSSSYIHLPHSIQFAGCSQFLYVPFT